MAKKLGNNYFLWVTTSAVGVFARIKGQQSLTRSATSSAIDTSTKDDFPYGTSAPGLFGFDITLTGIADLPDVDGYTNVETHFHNQTPVVVQIRHGGPTGTAADAVFEALCYILELSPSFPQNGTVPYSLRLGLAAAPTIDALA